MTQSSDGSFIYRASSSAPERFSDRTAGNCGIATVTGPSTYYHIDNNSSAAVQPADWLLKKQSSAR